MPWYTVEESYSEYSKGRRLVAVFAESLQDAENGLIEDSDVIEELWQDGQTTDTYLHYDTIKEEHNLAFPDGEEE
tara:strand:- start:185 stop:409 length:225 start_codon:yes stop_codon:yes gene_type:complete